MTTTGQKLSSCHWPDIQIKATRHKHHADQFEHVEAR